MQSNLQGFQSYKKGYGIREQREEELDEIEKEIGIGEIGASSKTLR